MTDHARRALCAGVTVDILVVVCDCESVRLCVCRCDCASVVGLRLCVSIQLCIIVCVGAVGSADNL